MALWPHLFRDREAVHVCWVCGEAPASWVPGEGYLCASCLEAEAGRREDDE